MYSYKSLEPLGGQRHQKSRQKDLYSSIQNSQHLPSYPSFYPSGPPGGRQSVSEWSRIGLNGTWQDIKSVYLIAWWRGMKWQKYDYVGLGRVWDCLARLQSRRFGEPAWGRSRDSGWSPWSHAIHSNFFSPIILSDKTSSICLLLPFLMSQAWDTLPIFWC